MSSVLKALKKLEDEKRGTAPPSPAAANQRWASGGHPERGRRPWLFVTAGLAIGLLVAGVLLWLGRKEVPVATVPVAENPRVKAGPTVAASPVPVIPQTPRVAVETPVPPIPSSPPVVASKIEPATVRPVPELPVAEASRAATVVVTTPTPSPAPPVLPARSAVPAALSEVPVKQVRVDRLEIPAAGQQWVAPPQLTVTEIFPATGEGRMAIVNGLPVMAGTMVEEALVEEIHDDRVVVSIGGRRVVLSLGRGR
jgi:hypothetical protein